MVELVAVTPKVSPILAAIDRMMASPATGKDPSSEQPRNPHAGAAAAGTKEALDETAELFRSIFKGEILP